MDKTTFAAAAIEASRSLLLPDLVRPEDLARHLDIPLDDATRLLRDLGVVEVAGVLVIGREDLLAAIRPVSLRAGDPDEEWLSAEFVAQRIGTSAKTLLRLAVEGRVPAILIPSPRPRYRFLLSQVVLALRLASNNRQG